MDSAAPPLSRVVRNDGLVPRKGDTPYAALRPTLILGSRIAGRGRAPFYRVRLPAQTAREAIVFCDRLRRAGGNCVVLRN